MFVICFLLVLDLVELKILDKEVFVNKIYLLFLLGVFFILFRSREKIRGRGKEWNIFFLYLWGNGYLY